MRTLVFILQKEFKQIFRNRALLPIIFFSPIVQLLVLPLVADYEIKNINITVVDYDCSSYSKRLVDKITASGYFRLADYPSSTRRAWEQIEADECDLILIIPPNFEKRLIRENKEKLLVAVNAINGVKANLAGSYIGEIIVDYNNDIRVEWMEPARFMNSATIFVTVSHWFNPPMNYRVFMVPGILVLLLTPVGGFMCALNIVKEKESGTIEQINVTPIKKYQFILGKLIPFWVIGMFIFSVGFLVVARFVYGIIPAGSTLLLYGYLSIYLIALLGFGLLISTFAETQQQAMSIAYFFMIIFVLMSGLFTSIDNMPPWAYMVAKCIPVTYFIDVVRMIVLKGSGFQDVQHHFIITALFSVVLNTLAILNYKKRN